MTTTTERVLRKGVFQHVEAELYAYPFRKREIARLREEIMHPYDEEINDPGVVKGKNSVRQPGDPTGRKAVALASKLHNVERITDAIDYAYGKLNEQQREFVKLKYWTQPQQLTATGIALQLGVEDRTCRRWRSRFVQDIADFLGW